MAQRQCCSTNPAVALLERFFYWWGCSVASHPWRVISATLAFTVISSLGMSYFGGVVSLSKIDMRFYKQGPDSIGKKFSRKSSWKSSRKSNLKRRHAPTTFSWIFYCNVLTGSSWGFSWGFFSQLNRAQILVSWFCPPKVDHENDWPYIWSALNH